MPTPTRKNLLDLIGEWMDGEYGYDTLEEHSTEDAIHMKDDARRILGLVRDYLNAQ